MHIVNVLEEGVLGGPQRRSIRVAAELPQISATSRTTIVLPLGSEQLVEACDVAEVAYSELPMKTLSRHPRAASAYIVSSLTQTLGLAHRLRKLKADVVHVSGGSFCWKGPLAAWLAKIPFVWHLNDTSAPKVVRSVFKFVVRLTKPDHIIYAAHAVRDYYGPLVDHQVPWSIVPSAFDDNLLQLDPAEVSDPMTNAGSDHRILMLANINPVKGIDFAIDAVAELRSRGHQAHLYVVGGTKETQIAYRDALISQIPDFHQLVTLVGYCADVSGYLAHANIFLCSSRSEASPLAVWEAAAAGLPIVSADVGDVARTLPHHEAALIVPVGDVGRCTDALETLIRDPALGKRLGAQARRCVKSRMSARAIAEASFSAYKSASANQ